MLVLYVVCLCYFGEGLLHQRVGERGIFIVVLVPGFAVGPILRIRSFVLVPKVKEKSGVSQLVFTILLPPPPQVSIAIQVENVNELVEVATASGVEVANFVVPLEVFEEEEDTMLQIK